MSQPCGGVVQVIDVIWMLLHNASARFTQGIEVCVKNTADESAPADLCWPKTEIQLERGKAGYSLVVLEHSEANLHF